MIKFYVTFSYKIVKIAIKNLKLNNKIQPQTLPNYVGLSLRS